MKTLRYAALLLLLTGAAMASAPDELAIGSAAPRTDIAMRDVSGKTLTLAQAKGKAGLLVIFSCNTCPFVRAWEDRYLQIAGKCSDIGIGVVLVNSNTAQHNGVDSFEAMQKHATEKKYTFPYVLDEGAVVADAFGANRTPHVFLFDASMKIVYRGAIDDNHDDASAVQHTYLIDALDALNEGKAPAVAETKSIGCTIKRK
jgi:peroxiredoxin